MSQPPAYTPETAFVTYQAQQAWFPGQNLDVEFADLATTITAIRTNLALLQKDDGTLGNGLVGWDQFSPALQVALRAQGFTGAPSAGPNTWIGLQTFSTGVLSAQYKLGTTVGAYTPAFVEVEAVTPPSGYTFAVPAFVFNDSASTGFSFSDASTHFAFTINGNKIATAGNPNGTGSYCALNATQFGMGCSNATYITGGLFQATAFFNPFGQNGGLFFGANAQVNIPPASGGVLTVAAAVSMELDLLIQQNVALKQSLRCYDYYAGGCTVPQNSSIIRMLKAPAGAGWNTGIVFASDYSAGYLDSGFPIIAGGVMIAGYTTSLTLASGLNLSGMLGGFSVGAIVLPSGAVANNGIIWGPSGLAGYILSATSSGGGGILFSNGFTFFQFGGASACWFTTGTTDGRLGLIGTGGGFTTLATANSSASNFTVTLPAITDTVVTLTASQALSNKTLSGTLVTLSSATTVLSATNTGGAANTAVFQSGAVGTDAWVTVQTNTANQFNLFAIGVAGHGFSGTAQGDGAIQAVNSLHFGSFTAGKGVFIYTGVGTLATTIDSSQNLTQVGFLKGSTIYATGDAGGVASTNAMSNVSSTTISSGTGTVKMSSTNSANNAVWIKLYAGTTAYWVPGWTTNAP